MLDLVVAFFQFAALAGAGAVAMAILLSGLIASLRLALLLAAPFAGFAVVVALMLIAGFSTLLQALAWVFAFLIFVAVLGILQHCEQRACAAIDACPYRTRPPHTRKITR